MATIHCHVQIEQGLEQLGIQAATPCTPGGGGGEANVGANVGIGEGLVYEGKDGVVLNFRTLKAGPNMTISTNVVDKVIEINSILGGGNVTGPDPSTTRAIATYEDATGQILLNNKLKIDTARLGASLPLRSLLALDDEGSPAWHDLIRLEFVSEGFTAGLATIVGDTDTDAILVASADPWISTPTGDGK
ncbi:MAG: hypothetical protein KAT00_15505, partial [Planctomycetes bacterium]|nr:hypothetical protein [Planctomycetota bacterium]